MRLGVGNFGSGFNNRAASCVGCCSGLLHWLTTMGCPGLVLHPLFLLTKSPLADHHGARAGLASPLGKLASLYLPFSPLCAWYLPVLVGNFAVLLRFTAFRADLRCTSGFMMVVLMIWQTLAFCDSPACSALLDYTWFSVTTSSTERGGHLDVWRFWFWRVAAGFCGCVWWCFWCVLALVFAPATVSPLVLRPTRTAYCAADVVKRRRFKKKKSACSQ